MSTWKKYISILFQDERVPAQVYNKDTSPPNTTAEARRSAEEMKESKAPGSNLHMEFSNRVLENTDAGVIINREKYSLRGRYGLYMLLFCRMSPGIYESWD